MRRLFPFPETDGARRRMTCADFVFVPTFHQIWSCWPVLILAFVLGCSGGGVRYPVRSDVANRALKTVLSHWKDGGRPEELHDTEPQIVMQDFDWAGGARLTEFAVEDNAVALDANLSVRVRLELIHADGRTETRNVWYLVGTDPVLTVFRDMLHP